MEQLLKLAEMFYKEATEKRYWGVKCSGALFVCRDDGTVFLAKRSSKVEQGGTWGIPGGAVDIFQDELEAKMDEIKGFPGFWYFPDLDDDKYPDPSVEVFEESALRETEEECGLVPEIAARLQVIDFKDNDEKDLHDKISNTQKTLIDIQTKIDCANGDNHLLVPLQREFESVKNDLDVLLKSLYQLGKEDDLIPKVSEIYATN